MSTNDITPEDMDLAIAAADEARRRMGPSVMPLVKAGPPPLPPRIAVRTEANAVEQLRSEQERAQTRTAKRVAETLACIPNGYAGLTLDSAGLAARVAPAGVIAGARAAKGAPGIVFVGPSGAGKTTLASALLATVVTQEGATRSVAWIPARRLANARRDHVLGEIPPLVAHATKVDILILDELGGEEATFASSVAEVICDRYDEARTTWITTGFDEGAIVARYGDGVARRVFGRSAIVTCRRSKA